MRRNQAGLNPGELQLLHLRHRRQVPRRRRRPPRRARLETASRVSISIPQPDCGAIAMEPSNHPSGCRNCPTTPRPENFVGRRSTDSGPTSPSLPATSTSPVTASPSSLRRRLSTRIPALFQQSSNTFAGSICPTNASLASVRHRWAGHLRRGTPRRPFRGLRIVGGRVAAVSPAKMPGRSVVSMSGGRRGRERAIVQWRAIARNSG